MHAQLQNFSIVLIVKNVCTFNNEQSFPDSGVSFFFVKLWQHIVDINNYYSLHEVFNVIQTSVLSFPAVVRTQLQQMEQTWPVTPRRTQKPSTPPAAREPFAMAEMQTLTSTNLPNFSKKNFISDSKLPVFWKYMLHFVNNLHN